MVDRPKYNEAENAKEQRVVIIMGSDKDVPHCEKISEVLDHFQIKCEKRIASAHKTPEFLLEMIKKYNKEDFQTVFIAVAGRSNALGGFIDFQTVFPVISAPPYSEKYGGADIYSSLRMPSGSASVTAIEAEMAALHAVKILALNNPHLANKLLEYQQEHREKIKKSDNDLNGISDVK